MKLTSKEIEKLDAYQLMAALGKKVIHPGGKKSTEELYAMTEFKPEYNVLEIGCEVGCTAMDIVKRFGCNITITDIDEKMLEKAKNNIESQGMQEKIRVVKGNIQQLPFEDKSFDVVIIEAVTMFVNREGAIKEVWRVCKHGGMVLEHEFMWRKKPTPEARKIFEGEVCRGIKLDTDKDWVFIYEKSGCKKLEIITGPFRMMSVKGFLDDEGVLNTMSIMLRTFSRVAYIRKMMWLMPRIMKVRDSLGYIVFAAMKQAGN